MRRGYNDAIPEKQFLKEFILTQFNFDMGFDLTHDNADIRSIPPMDGYTMGYELTTFKQFDFFRLHVHLKFGTSDILRPFILKVDPPYKNDSLEDEVWEATGALNFAHLFYTGYSFLPIDGETPDKAMLLRVDSIPFQLAGGGFILLSGENP